MSKTKKSYETAVPLHADGLELLFITTRDKTVAICSDLSYDKIVARHNGKGTLKSLHEASEHLFYQYVKDAKNHLTTV